MRRKDWSASAAFLNLKSLYGGITWLHLFFVYVRLSSNWDTSLPCYRTFCSRDRTPLSALVSFLSKTPFGAPHSMPYWTAMISVNLHFY